jgi:deoxyhypusine synthase
MLMLLREMKQKNRNLATGSVAKFVQKNYHHFNASVLREATDAYIHLLNNNGQMFVSLAGAMSTGELGISLAEMIRKKKIHGISCTGANLEEDVFNLVAHDSYVALPDYRNLTPEDDKKLKDKNLNRVTDVAVPGEAMKPIEDEITNLWKDAKRAGERKFPHEFLYELLLSKTLESSYQIDPKNSWMLAAAEVDLPIVVPGWEDSTLGNVFAAMCLNGDLDYSIMRGGIEYMMELAIWYDETSRSHDIGFFQVGGGIAGDFSICVVPMLQQDMHKKDTKLWSYFCQISDAVCSYGGYSGATPNEKITWGKIGPKTPSFVIESDASIVAPLIFAQILGL